MSKTLLVTGGSGFIGGQVLAAALAGGWKVVNGDRIEAAPMADVEFRELDITDEAAVSALLGAVNPQAVIHCAAIGDVDQSQNNPPVAWRVNGNRDVPATERATGETAVGHSTPPAFR